jgi:hypothetical protein
MPEPGLVRFGVGGQLEHCGWGARMLKLKLVRVKKSHPARTEQWDARVDDGAIKAILEAPEPDVPESDGIAVILQEERSERGNSGKLCRSRRTSLDRGSVLNEHAIVQNGKAARFDGTIRPLFGSAEDDVVGLPFSRLFRGVDQWRGHSVERTGLSLRIGFILVGIEHLNLVTALEVNAAVAPALPCPLDLGWSGPLNMQLHISKLLPGHDAARAVHNHHTILDLPAGRPTILTLPCVEIFPVEQHDRVGRWRSRLNDPRLGRPVRGFGAESRKGQQRHNEKTPSKILR